MRTPSHQQAAPAHRIPHVVPGIESRTHTEPPSALARPINAATSLKLLESRSSPGESLHITVMRSRMKGGKLRSQVVETTLTMCVTPAE
jgi:hypothetical protein